jgi:glycosyltransferase involved in cell wall biosynthesis
MTPSTDVTEPSSDLLAPATTNVEFHVLDVELGGPIAAINRIDNNRVEAHKALLLVRVLGQPIGLHRVTIPPEGLSTDQIFTQLIENFGEDVVARLGEPSLSVATLSMPALAGRSNAFRREHDRFLSNPEPCSVVVCTRDRTDELAACLQSLATQDHPNFEVWVVDNGPASGLTPAVVDRFRDRLDIHYVPEPRPGLSKARNTALRQDLKGDVVAWIDDDEIADPLWLSELARALDDRRDASAVSGVVVPAELATAPQVWFEQFGGHSKGRGFREEDFVDGRNGVEALYPLPAFGVGANMAFRLGPLRAIGGFDEALGAGTLTKGGEDTLAFTRLLQSGERTLYRPSALTRHFHRRDVEGLEQQMYGYGTGLTAFYTALLLRRPWILFKLIGLARRGLTDLRSPDSVRVAKVEDDFPPEMLRANRRGMVGGPVKYVRQRIENARGRATADETRGERP